MPLSPPFAGFVSRVAALFKTHPFAKALNAAIVVAAKTYAARAALYVSVIHDPAYVEVFNYGGVAADKFGG